MRILPRYKKCIICGKENPIGLNSYFETDNEYVYAKLSIDDRFVGYQNRIHGGIIASIIDEAMGWACIIKTKKLYYTIELTTRYKNPLKPNTAIVVKTHMIKTLKNIAYAEGMVIDENNIIIASAKGKYWPLAKTEEKKVFKFLHHEPEDNKPVNKNDL